MKHDENIERLMPDTSAPNIVEGPHRERLKHQLLHEMQTTNAQVQKWRRIMKSRIARVAAAAAVIIVAVAGYVALSTQGSGMLFAEMQEQIRAFRPYSCTFTIQYEGEAAHKSRVMQLSLTRRREIWADGFILVFDLSAMKVLRLFPEKKSAIETTYTGTGPKKDLDLLRILSTMQDGNEENLGRRKVEGRTAQGFHVPPRGESHDEWVVWVDKDTKLPIRIELAQKFRLFGKERNRTIVMSEFEFDVDFDESLFATTAPEGYTVERVEEPFRDYSKEPQK